MPRAGQLAPLLSLSLFLSFYSLGGFLGLPFPPNRAVGTGRRAPAAGLCAEAWQAAGAKILGINLGEVLGDPKVGLTQPIEAAFFFFISYFLLARWSEA